MNVSRNTTFQLEQMVFPNYSQPQELGSFSCDGGRIFYGDARMLQELVMPGHGEDSVQLRPSEQFDLSEGYERFVKRDERDKEYIDNILMWLMENEGLPQLQCQQSDTGKSGPTIPTMPRLNLDFVCWRGLLTKIMCTPYENMDGWIIAVSRINGTYYLCEFDTDKKVSDVLNASERYKLMMSYWGYRFEHYLTASADTAVAAEGKRREADCEAAARVGLHEEDPAAAVVVNNNVAYCGVFRSRLNAHSLLLAGEIDCVQRAGARAGARGEHYVELKTSRVVDAPHSRQDRNMKRYKMVKWWAQCFTANIPVIICGYRDDDGKVVSLERISISDIHKLCQVTLGQSCWKPTACMNFLDQFLSHIKVKVTEDSISDVHVFRWFPNRGAAGSNIEYCKYPNAPEQWTFLPRWYKLSTSEQVPRNMSGHVSGGLRHSDTPRTSS